MQRSRHLGHLQEVWEIFRFSYSGWLNFMRKLPPIIRLDPVDVATMFFNNTSLSAGFLHSARLPDKWSRFQQLIELAINLLQPSAVSCSRYVAPISCWLLPWDIALENLLLFSTLFKTLSTDLRTAGWSNLTWKSLIKPTVLLAAAAAVQSFNITPFYKVLRHAGESSNRLSSQDVRMIKCPGRCSA